MNECVLRILHDGILGIPMENFDFNSPFTHYYLHAFERIRKPWLLIEPLFSLTPLSNDQYKNQDDIYSYTKEILQRRITELRNGAPRKMSLMDFFIKISEEHPNFTNDDIINEITTFMSATITISRLFYHSERKKFQGQESVATTMTFTLYYLAKHQDVQEKVMEEQRSINFDKGEMTLDMTKQMAYLKQCINETLRLYPAGPVLARITTEDVTVGEITIPRGTNLFISPCSTHRLEHIYPDPEMFDPERFSADNIKKRHPYAFIPFSVGPRNCIGYKFAYLEMISILSTLLRNYHVSLVPGKENLTVYFRITPRAKGGVWLKLTPRKS
ncbi:hypothetical protein NQ318_008168 [Aromia moschata]|uniref:Cytochrome P450 n=1 Tax=Aromia moschata TaxID=1265417 RepID=A0AAV8YHK6_9CUCU|nr:hypothetical protein NQ318_008168 [Aromia moschata]